MASRVLEMMRDEQSKVLHAIPSMKCAESLEVDCSVKTSELEEDSSELKID